MSDRREGVNAPLIQHGHQEAVYNVILVMGICDLVAAKFCSTIIEGSFTHTAAERTWIRFLPVIENDLAYMSFAYRIIDSKSLNPRSTVIASISNGMG